jgi:undecaprenyl-diphosphatase
MSIFEAIILGLVQGLTEFIPVSSSGHLVILHEFLGVKDGGLSFDVALHIGTLLALVIYFYRDILELAQGLMGRNNKKRLAWLIVAATIPAVVAGMLIKDTAESSLRNVWLVCANLIIVAILMLAAERYAKKYKNPTPLEKVKPKQALIVGIAQAAALIPGISRSGSTITAGLFTGIDRVAATRFSFLLAIPITLGAIVKVLIDDNGALADGSVTVLVVGIWTAFLSGLFAIRFLLRYLSKRSLAAFAYYRIGVALVVLLLMSTR